MKLRHTGIAALLLLGLAQAASAQQASVQMASIDVSRLPIDVQRIQRRLAQATRERETRDGLNLRYIVDVFGQAPPIELFTKEDNLLNGPVPYGGPTHKEMLYMITPEEFRAPVMDFNSLFRWLADKSKSKDKDKK
jgi:hypothetical protein